MAQLSAWMGAGVVAAGVSAALIAGADAASADTGSDTAGASASASADSGDDTAAEAGSTDSAGDNDADEADDAAEDAEADADIDADADEEVDADEEADAEEEVDDPSDGNAELADAGDDDVPALEDDDTPTVDEAVSEPVTVEETSSEVPAAESTEGTADELSPVADDPSVAADMSASQRVSQTLDAPAALAAAPTRTLQDVFQSLMMEIIGAAVRFVSGPPVVPPGSKVTVRSSRLEIEDGRYVRADWYYPEGDETPERLIYLQHGYLGIGPMYSYTAAWLAERTNSIVVAPTLSSNRYVKDGFWLGDDQVYRATAALLLGDRDALTASAVAAGLARKYGADAALPDRFTLVGHSLGAGVAAGAAGYYAEAVIAGGDTNHLAGIITLDGAPPGSVLSEALDKLEGLGAYIPVLELGAPRDGETRRVDEALNGHRPGHFNGVVLDGGEHLDAMQGGSWLIQLVSYLYQGFPTEQNKAAAQTLIAGWINDIFAGRIDSSTGACEGAGCAGIYGDPGQSVSIATPEGPATGVVIGTPAAPVRTEFLPPSVSSLLASRSTAVRLAVAG
jgi:pimeloyl-ACP methyl ester carboxylesterase